MTPRRSTQRDDDDYDYQRRMGDERLRELGDVVRERYRTRTYESGAEFTDAHARRATEKRMLSCIRLGNPSIIPELLAAAMASEQEHSKDPLSASPLTDARYQFVSTVTLFCRQAIDAGLPEALAFNMNDAYIQQLDYLDRIEDIVLLIFNALRDYCNEVRDWRLRKTRPEVRSCCEYISLHMHDRITLSDLARVARLSNSRVSAIFVEELDVRPMEYVRARKLEYAAMVLDDFDTPVAYLAELLAFPSASAFVQQFKDSYGMTPAAWRRRAR